MRPGRTTSERNKSQCVLRGVTCWLTVGAKAAGRGGRGPNGAACPTVNLAPGVAETSLVARPRVSPVGKLHSTNASRAFRMVAEQADMIDHRAVVGEAVGQAEA